MYYERMLDISKIEDLYKGIRSKTKHKEKIVNFKLFYMSNIIQIYEILSQKLYRHGLYNIFLVKENKYRLIMSENLSDKIVNHLLSKEILLPFLEPKLIETNVATRKGKGTKAGLYYTKKYINEIRRKHEEFFVLKCDIKKYFYNIDHKILLDMISKVIPDQDVLELLKNILDVTNDFSTNQVITKVIENEKLRLKKTNNAHLKQKYLELDSIPTYSPGKVLPIGNLSSQILAVFYLNELDHFIKEKLKIKYYLRYMDDLVLFHEDKEYLKYCLKSIKEKLENEYLLELHPKKTKIFSFNQGFTFLGYRFFIKNNRLILLMVSKTKKRIVRNIKRVKKKNFEKYSKTMASYHGYFLNCKCQSFLKKHDFS